MNERDLGRHDEAIDTLKADVAQLREDVSEIKELLAGARGGWKSLVWVVGVASAAGAGLMAGVSFVRYLWGPAG